MALEETAGKQYSHVGHLVGDNEGGGESLVPVEGAGPGGLAHPCHGGVARRAPQVGPGEPHGHVVTQAGR